MAHDHMKLILGIASDCSFSIFAEPPAPGFRLKFSLPPPTFVFFLLLISRFLLLVSFRRGFSTLLHCFRFVLVFRARSGLRLLFPQPYLQIRSASGDMDRTFFSTLTHFFRFVPIVFCSDPFASSGCNHL